MNCPICGSGPTGPGKVWLVNADYGYGHGAEYKCHNHPELRDGYRFVVHSEEAKAESDAQRALSQANAAALRARLDVPAYERLLSAMLPAMRDVSSLNATAPGRIQLGLVREQDLSPEVYKLYLGGWRDLAMGAAFKFMCGEIDRVDREHAELSQRLAALEKGADDGK